MKTIVFKDGSTILTDDSVVADLIGEDDKMMAITDVYGNVHTVNRFFIGRTRDANHEEVRTFSDYKMRSAVTLSSGHDRDHKQSSPETARAYVAFWKMCHKQNKMYLCKKENKAERHKWIEDYKKTLDPQKKCTVKLIGGTERQISHEQHQVMIDILEGRREPENDKQEEFILNVYKIEC